MRTKQDKKNEREKEHVQRVLDCHNKKYGTHIAIKKKTEDVYPCLKGQNNWDWVCYDTETSEEIAVEAKNLTDEESEVKRNTIRGVLKEIGNCLSNKLPGSFDLDINIPPKNDSLPLQKRDKQKFKDVLCKTIFQTAQTLKLEEKRDLMPQIIQQLPLALPDSFSCTIHKFSDDGSGLLIFTGSTDEWSLKLTECELKKFKELVSYANNEQLRLAKEEFNVKETFLVIIEERLRISDPDTVADALKRINRVSYSQINHIYYISGEKVEEILLPTP